MSRRLGWGVGDSKVISAPSPNVALSAVSVEYLTEPEGSLDDPIIKALHQEIISTMRELLKTSFIYKEQFEQVIRFYNLDNPLKLAGSSTSQLIWSD